MLINTRATLPVARVLIFSLISDQRDGTAVLKRLAASLYGSGIRYVVFTTYEHGQDSDAIMGTQFLITYFFFRVLTLFRPTAQSIGRVYPGSL
jgi:hypothetical protein